MVLIPSAPAECRGFFAEQIDPILVGIGFRGAGGAARRTHGRGSGFLADVREDFGPFRFREVGQDRGLVVMPRRPRRTPVGMLRHQLLNRRIRLRAVPEDVGDFGKDGVGLGIDLLLHRRLPLRRLPLGVVLLQRGDFTVEGFGDGVVDNRLHPIRTERRDLASLPVVHDEIRIQIDGGCATRR